MRKLEKLIVIVFFIAIILICSVTVYLVLAPKEDERFTEFYVLGSNGQLGDYPTNLTVGEKATVTLGVVNHENQNVTYRIVVNLDHEPLETLSNIELGNEAAWTQNCTFTSQKIGEKISLDFQLYRDGLVAPYHSLQLWLTVRSAQ
jgi:uncharacterized membrane protein